MHHVRAACPRLALLLVWALTSPSLAATGTCLRLTDAGETRVR